MLPSLTPGLRGLQSNHFCSSTQLSRGGSTAFSVDGGGYLVRFYSITFSGQMNIRVSLRASMLTGVVCVCFLVWTQTSDHTPPLSPSVGFCLISSFLVCPLLTCVILFSQQKAKETSETEATEQSTKTFDSRLRWGHGHVAVQELLHFTCQRPTSSRHYSEGHGCLQHEWTCHRAEKLEKILLAQSRLGFNHFQ